MNLRDYLVMSQGRPIMHVEGQLGFRLASDGVLQVRVLAAESDFSTEEMNKERRRVRSRRTRGV